MSKHTESLNEIRTWILTIDDPLFYGPLYRSLVSKYPNKFAGVIILPVKNGFVSTLREVIYRIRFHGFYSFTKLLTIRCAHQLFSTSLHREAKKQNIVSKRCENLSEAVEELLLVNAQRCFASVQEKLNPDAINLMSQGWVNIHCGKLPNYSGQDAPFWAMYNGETNVTVSVHFMNEEIDGGPIIGQKTLPNNGETYYSLVKMLFEQAYLIIEKNLLTKTTHIQDAVIQKVGTRKYYPKPPVALGVKFRKNGGKFC